MFNIDKNDKNRIVHYRSCIYYGYNLQFQENYFLEKVIKKISDAFIEVEGKTYHYFPDKLSADEQFGLVEEFYKQLYGQDISKQLNEYFDKMLFVDNADFIKANAVLHRKYDLSKPSIQYFNIDYMENIISSYLMVHEIGHAMYYPAKNYVHNEVIAMTLQRIFGRTYDHELNVLHSRQAIESIFFDSEKYDNIFWKKTREKLKKADKLYCYMYLIGYISSLYLSAYYQMDKSKFKNKLIELRNDKEACEKLFKYYAINLESDLTEELVDVEIQKVIKRVSN